MRSVHAAVKHGYGTGGSGLSTLRVQLRAVKGTMVRLRTVRVRVGNPGQRALKSNRGWPGPVDPEAQPPALPGLISSIDLKKPFGTWLLGTPFGSHSRCLLLFLLTTLNTSF